MQRYFINSWLLPCSLRSHRIATPRPKMGFAIFRLCPSTTLMQANRLEEKLRLNVLYSLENVLQETKDDFKESLLEIQSLINPEQKRKLINNI